MMNQYYLLILLLLLFVVLPFLYVESRNLIKTESHSNKVIREFIHATNNNTDESQGTRWAVLIAGSNGYDNYRHQADICHAYQILKKGGLKDENIIVFMYDDIAFSEYNPRPGIIINKPNGEDVYAGVPKDYIGEDVNVKNFLAVLIGDKTALNGSGSGKVVDSNPNDYIFVFYADHGAAGILGMPGEQEELYADQLNEALRTKYNLGTYKSLVFYVEACESGSMFEGLLSNGMNIYVTTAANSEESSWAIYCPDSYPSPPSEYDTCLGDLYSVSWLEDSEKYNMKTETLNKQYEVVKRRTKYENPFLPGSNVLQFGDIDQLSNETLYTYIGTNPDNDEYNSSIEPNSLLPSAPVLFSNFVEQRNTDIVHFLHQYLNAPQGSSKKLKAWKKYRDAMEHKMYTDRSMKLVGEFLFGSEKGSEVMKTVRPAGQSLVDDWTCLRTMVKTYEKYCGSFSRYGFKYTRSLANICNVGVKPEKMAEASAYACTRRHQSSLHKRLRS